MRSLIKHFITLGLVALVSTSAYASNITDSTQKYQFDNGYDSFYSQEGGLWERGKGWTYTKPDGTEAIGWVLIDGDYHYFDENGWMYANCYTPDGYFVDSNGVWIEGAADTAANQSQQACVDVISNDGYYDMGYGANNYGGMAIQGNQLYAIGTMTHRGNVKKYDYGTYIFELDPNVDFVIFNEAGYHSTTFSNLMAHQICMRILVENGKVVEVMSHT